MSDSCDSGMFVSVDGAGFYEDRSRPFHCGGYPARQWPDERSAIAFAEAEQAVSNLEGNPWWYRYRVHRAYRDCTRRDLVHETSPVREGECAETPEAGLELDQRRLIAWFNVLVAHAAIAMGDWV